jgi:hypothetical protein
MNALEFCQRKVVKVRRHEELGAAARIMRERHRRTEAHREQMG